MRIRRLYIACQVIGWFSYIILVFILNRISGIPIGPSLFLSLGTAFLLGLLLSHGYREIILRNDWLNLSIKNIIPRFLIGSLSMAILFEIWYVTITQIIPNSISALKLSIMAQEITGWVVLFLLWSLIYFFYHFFKTYKAEEIKNLRWEASKNEFELNKLKSQLNPHFMFNSMNTIRALIDENPKTAKLAVTQLSNILRSNLLIGRKKLIPLEEEVKLVKDYLSVEGYRYEERLTTLFDIKQETKGILIPPLMIQTLVENGIKHGISKLPSGGTITLKTSISGDVMKVEIINSGQYNGNQESETGFGLINTKERLKILYGNLASFSICNLNKNMVLTEIRIPLNYNL
ncbi:MAG: sensor histidine kinase [Salibacteraceae bacterium]